MRGGYAPTPTSSQAATLSRMYRERRTQVEIADTLGVPRTRVRIWYHRFGFTALPRTEGAAAGRAAARGA
jgi:DNA-directed RNA polymerase specialized sigma24 family protein